MVGFKYSGGGAPASPSLTEAMGYLGALGKETVLGWASPRAPEFVVILGLNPPKSGCLGTPSLLACLPVTPGIFACILVILGLDAGILVILGPYACVPVILGLCACVPVTLGP